jgi:hypothetical protein
MRFMQSVQKLPPVRKSGKVERSPTLGVVMDRRALDAAESLQAYPNISAAAALLGVDASTLSRRADLAIRPRGERDRVLAPLEVMRLAVIYRKRSLNDVAHDLIEHARAVDAGAVSRVEEEIQGFFEGREVRDEDLAKFLELGRRLLPASLLTEIEAVLTTKGAKLPPVIRGDVPLPDA